MANFLNEKSGIYGCFEGSYFRIPKSSNTYVPENADYTKSSNGVYMYPTRKTCSITIYEYVSSLTSTCNAMRVAFMKEYIIGEKVINIDNINDDYIITVSYNLYNKDGELISSGSNAMASERTSLAVITDGVKEDNSLEYRKAILSDSRIELQIPMISRYGINKQCSQGPYTLEITGIRLESTIGENKFGVESDTQIMHGSCNHHISHYATHCNYHFCRPDHMVFNNYASNFITNAKVGTSIIDQTVVPTRLEIPPEYTRVILSDIKYENPLKFKIDNGIETIILYSECLIDNLNIVYDNSDINALLSLNKDNIDENVGNE